MSLPEAEKVRQNQRCHRKRKCSVHGLLCRVNLDKQSPGDKRLGDIAEERRGCIHVTSSQTVQQMSADVTGSSHCKTELFNLSKPDN